MAVLEVEDRENVEESSLSSSHHRQDTKLALHSKIAFAVLILLASAEFAVRGPIRFLRGGDLNDFTSPYAQTRLMLGGLDPYSSQNLVAHWPEGAQRSEFLDRELADNSLTVNRGIPTAYPPTCFLLLTLFAVLPWKVAGIVWSSFSLLLVLWMIHSLAKLAGRSQGQHYLFAALALALAPWHTGLATGAIAVPAIALCGLACVDALGRKDFRAGILLGIATCLKPQIGLPFLLFYVLRKRWRVSGPGLASVAVAGFAALAYLGLTKTPWIANYRSDNHVLLQTGILSDFTERNPLRFGLVNLQVLFYALLKHPATINILAAAVTAAIFLILLWRRTEDHLLELSSVAVLSLLPIYHRFYDASLLVLPLCWSLKEWSGPRRRVARATLALILPFLFPGGSALENWWQSGQISTTITQSWWWISIVMPHQIWLMLAMSAIFLWAMNWQERKIRPVLHLDAPAGETSTPAAGRGV